MQTIIFVSFESLIILEEMILSLQKHYRKKIIKRINNRMRTPMINTIQEYLHLAANDNIQDNNKTRTEELSPAVIGEILHHYPEKKRGSFTTNIFPPKSCVFYVQTKMRTFASPLR